MTFLTNFKNAFSNPFQKSYIGNLTLGLLSYRKPLGILKIVPGAGYDTYTREYRPIAEKQRQKLTNGKGEKLDRNDALQEQKLESVSVFKLASRNFHLFVSFSLQILFIGRGVAAYTTFGREN